MSSNKNLEIKNFFAALLIFLSKSEEVSVREEFIKEYNRNLKKLSEILNYDFKNFKISEEHLDLDNTEMPFQGFSDSGADNKPERTYTRDYLILKLNQLILTINDLNKKI